MGSKHKQESNAPTRLQTLLVRRSGDGRFHCTQVCFLIDVEFGLYIFYFAVRIQENLMLILSWNSAI